MKHFVYDDSMEVADLLLDILIGLDLVSAETVDEYIAAVFALGRHPVASSL